MNGWGVALAVCSVLPAAAAERPLLEAGYRYMYNLEFDQAHRCFSEWERLHPEDPMAPVSEAAAYLFSEFERLHILQTEFFMHDENFRRHGGSRPDENLNRRFLEALARGQRKADQILSRSPGDANATFAAILREGLYSDFLALIEQSNLRALRESKAGRELAERLVARDPSYADAYLAIGVENYLLSLKPMPVRWVLRLGGAQTDKEVGIAKLRITAANGRYLQPFARLLLAVAALRDKDRSQAAELLSGLAAEFPRNKLYAEELARLRQGKQ
jgi:hypothetical protein